MACHSNCLVDRYPYYSCQDGLCHSEPAPPDVTYGAQEVEEAQKLCKNTESISKLVKKVKRDLDVLEGYAIKIVKGIEQINLDN